MNLFNIENSYASMEKRGWDRIYWFVDVHGTIAVPDYLDETKKKQFYPFARQVLRYLSKRDDTCLILWTCSHNDDINVILKWLQQNKIYFEYVNENPECKTTERVNLEQKPYYNVLLDDRAGFEPETDWRLIFQKLEEIFGALLI